MTTLVTHIMISSYCTFLWVIPVIVIQFKWKILNETVSVTDVICKLYISHAQSRTHGVRLPQCIAADGEGKCFRGSSSLANPSRFSTYSCFLMFLHLTAVLCTRYQLYVGYPVRGIVERRR